jgi:hypothetical protein
METLKTILLKIINGRGLDNQISYLKAKLKQYESPSINAIRLNGEN